MNGSKYKIIATGDITLRLGKKSKTVKISDRKNAIIEKVWQNALRKAGQLFNGSLLNFSTIGINGNKISIGGYFVEYKQFMANRKRPDLKLNIRPIGVSGMIITKEKGSNYVVFAKRINVTDYNDFLELVPSGGIDQKFTLDNGDIDYKANLLSEFFEETGLSKNYVKQISGFAIVLDTSKNIYDICCTILINKNRVMVKRYFTKSEEYKNLQFVPLKDLNTFIKTHAGSIVPTSIALIKAYEKFIH